MKLSMDRMLYFRHYAMTGLLFITLVWLVYHVMSLKWNDHTKVMTQPPATTPWMVPHSMRGLIVDRHHYPLAVSVPVYAILAYPVLLNKQPVTLLQQLADKLSLSTDDLHKKLQTSLTQKSVYLKKQVDLKTIQTIQKMSIPGVLVQLEYKRYYPLAEVTHTLLGDINQDGVGKAGIEQIFDRQLQQRVGHGSSPLILSLDARLQYLAYQFLTDAMQQQKQGVTSGQLVMLDIKSGEVLAMLHRENGQVPLVSSKNPILTETFEPGDVLKPFTYMASLISGRLNASINSCADIPAEHIGLTLGGAYIQRWLQKFSFGQPTRLPWPNESVGDFFYSNDWDQTKSMALASGYGVSVTNMQVVNAYATLARHGQKIQPTLLKRNHPPSPQTIVSSTAADQVIQVMSDSLLCQKTAKDVKVPHYKVAGRMGIARSLSATSHQLDHMAMFVGVFPLPNPRLVTLISLKMSQNLEGEKALQLVTYLFSHLMSASAALLGIPP